MHLSPSVDLRNSGAPTLHFALTNLQFAFLNVQFFIIYYIYVCCFILSLLCLILFQGPFLHVDFLPTAGAELGNQMFQVKS